MTTPKATGTQAAHRDRVLKQIAIDCLGIVEMETRGSDALDFHDLAIWNIRRALEAAYEAGRKASR